MALAHDDLPLSGRDRVAQQLGFASFAAYQHQRFYHEQQSISALALETGLSKDEIRAAIAIVPAAQGGPCSLFGCPPPRSAAARPWQRRSTSAPAYVTAGEAARVLHLSRRTLQRLLRETPDCGVWRTPGRHARLPWATVVRLGKQLGLGELMPPGR